MVSAESIDRFRITNGEVILAERPDARLISRIHKAARPLLVVNGSLGFTGSLDFLYEVGPLLTGLELVGAFGDDGPVSACSNLLELNLDTDCQNSITWENLARLRYLFAHADRVNDSFPALQGLETLHLYRASDREIVRVLELGSLHEIRLSSTKVTRIPGQGPWGKLRTLNINLAPSLKDFDDISEMTQLEALSLEGCRHLRELNFVRSCRALRFLNIGDSGKIESLRPLESCRNLEELLFYGNTVVEDGDLSVLGRLPHLERASFQKRRHYRGAPTKFPTLD